MPDIKQVACLGGGVIGASWASLFAAAGYDVAVYDPAPDSDAFVTAYAARVWPTLQALGLPATDALPKFRFCQSAPDAVTGVGFVQESVPERIEIKHALFAEIEPALSPDAVVATSASGLMISEMQTGWKNPARLVLGHPFNPPHLIPLVELLGNDATDPEALDIAQAFYESCGKVTIRVRREVPGHVANRLQAALWREAISLVDAGVATVEDVDTAIWAGPGLRWAAMGPHMLFHLGAGEAGIEEFCTRYRDSFHRWWDSMGDLRIDDGITEKLRDGIQAEQGSRSASDLMAERDALILAMLTATQSKRQS